ncbi:UNVERIFIED_CONTAM: ADP-ribosylglycohydrolase [Williamsia faeni]
MTLNDVRTDRAKGALLDLTVGDVLGAGYESTHPTPETAIDMIGGGSFDWAPGEWTDDTSMAVAIALAAEDTNMWSGIVRTRLPPMPVGHVGIL